MAENIWIMKVTFEDGHEAQRIFRSELPDSYVLSVLMRMRDDNKEHGAVTKVVVE